MSSKASISHDEWLAALESTSRVDDPEAMTSREIGALLGLSPSATKVRIRKLVDGGKATSARKRMTDSSGRAQWVAAYRLVK